MNQAVFTTLVLVGFVDYGHCASFFFGPTTNTDDACILVNMDAVFELSKTVDGKTEVAPMFSVSGASVVRGRSICASHTSAPTMSLSLFPTQETFRMNFRTSGSSQEINVSFSLLLDPAQHFENSTSEPPLVLDSSEELPAGEKNMSFKCDSVQTVVFNRDPTYKMTLTLTNFKAQAYDIFGGKFSPEQACDANTSTTPHTTKPTTTTTKRAPETTTPATEAHTVEITTTPTTEPNPETTTTRHVSETTEKSLTTTEIGAVTTPVVTSTVYSVKNGNVVCIVLQAKISFLAEYMTDTQLHTTAMVEIPDDAQSRGRCSKYNISTETEEIRVSFFNDTWRFVVEIAHDSAFRQGSQRLLEREDVGMYSWKRVQLSYVLDDHFLGAQHAGKKRKAVSENGTEYFATSPAGSYKCSSGERLSLSEGVTVDLANFQYRAFGTSDSTEFSSEGVARCPVDDENADADDDSITRAILLGSILGGVGILVIILTAVVVVRGRRPKHSYETL